MSIEQGRKLRQWRLIVDTPALGACNMAVDEAILAAVGAGAAPPTLRLYDWHPPCLSLGYGQRAGDADHALLEQRGWGIVRRPTGGRAILHADELTYSLALPIDDPLASGGVVESYHNISQALVSALTALGTAAQAVYAEKTAGTALSPVCFDTPSHYEITVGRRKLVGSAQVRRRSGVLQHGTLPLSGDIARICEVLAYPDESARDAARAEVRARALTLEQALGAPVAWQAAADAVVRGFAEAFNVAFMPQRLSRAESADAERLSTELYANPAWTYRR